MKYIEIAGVASLLLNFIFHELLAPNNGDPYAELFRW